jgi:hypothetical protein
MEAMGAHSNPCAPVPLERLASLHTSLRAGSGATAVPRTTRRKPQRVLETILQILESAEGPMHARDIHAAAEELLGAPVSWPSLKDYLSTHAQGERPRFQRVAPGVVSAGWQLLALARGNSPTGPVGGPPWMGPVRAAPSVGDGPMHRVGNSAGILMPLQLCPSSLSYAGFANDPGRKGPYAETHTMG